VLPEMFCDGIGQGCQSVEIEIAPVCRQYGRLFIVEAGEATQTEDARMPGKRPQNCVAWTGQTVEKKNSAVLGKERRNRIGDGGQPAEGKNFTIFRKQGSRAFAQGRERIESQ